MPIFTQKCSFGFTNKISRKSGVIMSFWMLAAFPAACRNLLKRYLPYQEILPIFSDIVCQTALYEQKIKLNSTEPKRQKMVENGSGDCQSK